MGELAEAPGVLRLAQSARPYAPAAPSPTKTLWGAAGLALAVAASALALLSGRVEGPTKAPAPRSHAPASLLIAGQNLPAKLRTIEGYAKGSQVSLEVGPRLTNIVYVARRGDDFASVGQRFGLRARTVRLVNMLPLGARIRAGQRLVITPTDGAYHRVRSGETLSELATRYRVSVASLRSHNPGLTGDKLALSRPVFIPGALELRYREQRTAILPERGYRSGGRWAKRLKASRSLVGAFGSRVGELAWPTSGQMSSPFGIRGYSFHPGVDICNVVGTPIHAAKGGVVVSAGWMGAYGYAVDIDHGGGVVTRYGHCSRVLVAAGESVGPGQPIARMGSTGRSTGPHLHFEVRIHGRAVNPSSFF
ncbi:MAG: peptidoglycan DD-metalloendopeptidase family protein [Candidatus Sericytochromatia bacterium]|nr:peptidoglycan DD-metalloendopeptidase family protein [Candidatus Sericytochromatia bacterium]